MNNPLSEKSWSPYVVGVGIGVLSWFAFLTADQLSSKVSGDQNAPAVPPLWQQRFGSSMVKHFVVAFHGGAGQLYLFPRLVARDNCSRIGIARVRFHEAGDRSGVERLGIAPEPKADYERRPDGSGGCEEPGNDAQQLCYSAGVMVLSKEHPRVILHRSTEPLMTPLLLPQERHGTVSNVVFPTGTDRRDDLGSPDHFDVYYGMADNRIGVARLDVRESLPPKALADPSRARGSFQTGGQSQTEVRPEVPITIRGGSSQWRLGHD